MLQEIRRCASNINIANSSPMFVFECKKIGVIIHGNLS